MFLGSCYQALEIFCMMNRAPKFIPLVKSLAFVVHFLYNIVVIKALPIKKEI